VAYKREPHGARNTCVPNLASFAYRRSLRWPTFRDAILDVSGSGIICSSLDEAHQRIPSSGQKYAIRLSNHVVLSAICPHGFEHRPGFLSGDTAQTAHSNSFSALLESSTHNASVRGVSQCFQPNTRDENVGFAGSKKTSPIQVGFPQRRVVQSRRRTFGRRTPKLNSLVCSNEYPADS